MKQKLGIVLTAFGVVACVAFSMQRMEAQSGPYAMYTSGPMQLTVTTKSGQTLAALGIPAGVELSVSAPSVSGNAGEPWDGKSLPTTFTGDVSIRTRPRSEIVSGSSREQMLTAPFRLEVQDAVVVVTRQQ
jgi:hypothetical protein